MDRAKIQILVSTYNGERFLRKQLDSLVSQTCKNFEILIRDDGSRDGTIDILREYEKKYENIRVFEGRNTGVTKSFFELLKLSNADYIAFCDQDDIWLPNKVEHAVSLIQQHENNGKTSVLYMSNKILIDAEGNIIKDNLHIKYKPGFSNALVENICTGCTSVLNKELVDSIKEHIPNNAVIHDWWCYLVGTYLGTVIFDDDAYIQYRQHGNNVLGQSATFFGTIRAKIRHLKRSRGKLQLQLTEFRKFYQGDFEKDRKVELVLDSTHFLSKIKVVFGKVVYRQQRLDGIVTRVLILINRML